MGLQVVGDQEQDVGTAFQQRTPYLWILEPHAPGDRARCQLVRTHLRSHRNDGGHDILAPACERRTKRITLAVDKGYDVEVTLPLECSRS
jgi:hypothetical protein